MRAKYITAGLLAMVPAIGQAQTNDSDTADIVVMANRREQAIYNVGMSLTALPSDAIQQRNVTSVSDLQNLVSGLSVATSGQAVPIYSLRGVGVSEQSLASQSSVAIYVDEVPLTLPVYTQGAALDLQRVEVLKGPQGTLYGQNSTGGAINYIVAKPTDHMATGGLLSYGRFNTVSAEAFLSGPLSSNLRGRIALRTVQADDWQRSYRRDATLGAMHKYAGRLILEWEPSDDFKITLNGNGWIDKSDTQAAQLAKLVPPSPATALARVLRAPLAPADPRAADWDAQPDLSRDSQFYQGSIRVDWNFNDLFKLTWISAYSDFRQTALSDLDGIGVDTIDKADVVDLRNGQQSRGKSFNQEVRLATDIRGMSVIVGGNYMHDRITETFAQLLPDGSLVQNILGVPVAGANVVTNQKIESWAAFANVDIPLGMQFSLNGGLRYTNQTRVFRGCTQPLNDKDAAAYNGLNDFFRGLRLGLPPVPAAQRASAFTCYSGDATYVPELAVRRLAEDSVSWNVNLNWTPRQRMLFYARASNGFKGGNFPNISASNNSAYRAVVQEELRAYEVGARIGFGPRFRIEGAAFWYDYTNKQQRGRVDVGPPFGFVNTQVNIPRSRIKGAEVSVATTPLRGLSINASAVYLDAKVRQFTGVTLDGITANLAGARLNYTPEWSANADVNYEVTLSEAIKGFVGGNLTYRSKTSGGIGASSAFDIDAYTLVDAQLGIADQDDKWRVWVFGKNITNKYYWINVTQNSDVVVRYAGMPATYGISASFRY